MGLGSILVHREPYVDHPEARTPPRDVETGLLPHPLLCTFHKVFMKAVPDGHRLFLSTELDSAINVLEPQQLSCRDKSTVVISPGNGEEKATDVHYTAIPRAPRASLPPQPEALLRQTHWPGSTGSH